MSIENNCERFFKKYQECERGEGGWGGWEPEAERERERESGRELTTEAEATKGLGG